MPRTCRCKNLRCLWRMSALLLALVHGDAFSPQLQRRTSCLPGFYCPLGSFTPVPCPKGTYGPTADAVSIDGCLDCPPHHYCPRPGLPGALPCGSLAQQPRPAQGSCVCPGEGQNFQASDGQCRCTIGYRLYNNGDSCVHKLYDVCRDGRKRSQYGDCWDRHQWRLHCRDHVCGSTADYQGYDGELGLCICREPPGRAACGGLCRRTSAPELKLQCQASGEMELVWSYDGRLSVMSGGALEAVFKRWDLQGSLLCNVHLNSSRPVYVVQTTEGGFLGLLSGLPEELQKLFPVKQQDTQIPAESASDFLWTTTENENISRAGREVNSSSRSSSSRRRRRRRRGDMEEARETNITGVLNPTACLHLGDVLLFTVDTHHYPLYDLDSLYNTNSDFDWGALRQLREELTLSWTPPPFFSVAFVQPGVHVFSLSSRQHKHLYVRVMPANAQCYEPGPFFPATAGHMTRVGIRRRRNLLLRPDWLVTGGLLFGAVVILCLCVTLLILFREYGWPEKQPIRVKYRLLQLAYHIEDYSSRGSRVMSLQRIHRNQQARMTQDFIQADASAEFWDYEQQVDLEAFSSSTFYSLLIKQSQFVTSRLELLTTEVKVLYQGVLGKLQPLHPRLMTVERMEEGYERMRKEVEREVQRRKILGSQLRTLLESQLEALGREQRAQQKVTSRFTSQLRESTRLLSRVSNSNQASGEEHHQILTQRLTVLMDQMGELVTAECQRQGAWGLLGEGTGAQLLCPDSGAVLTKEHIFGSDGSPRVCQALHCDPVTGLIQPNPHSHMLLGSGHIMAVPPDFFLHPQTGRVLPIAGNVAYDPASSTLVFTTDSYPGDDRKWDYPLLPFIPYPTSRHSDQPLCNTRLRRLKPGQRLQLGVPMADPDTGVPVPILAVTIHPKTGLVYPLGGVYTCPITRLPQPIQIGCPMLDSRTGNVVLTVGVSLDPVTGAVRPVGGVLLAESIIEPLSGRLVRVGGASERAGQLLPNAGGYQALLDSKVLMAMLKALELLGSPTGGRGPPDHLLSAAKELQQAWERSLHCQLQLQTRLEVLLDWAAGLQQDGGILGEMPLPGPDPGVPALLGMDYPDPGGSGLNVPVLGCETEPVTGIRIPLAGTMEDPDGKGLVAIRYGSPSADPVTRAMDPVVGARMDASRKTIIPITASYWLIMADQTDGAQVEALQREACLRNTHWQQQRRREEDLLSDLDSALFQFLFRATEGNSHRVGRDQWSGRQLREAAAELQDSAQTEARRRSAQNSRLTLVLPPRVLRILTRGDEGEWDQQCVWHSELMSGLEKLDVSMETLQRDEEKWTTGDWTTNLQVMDRELRQREALEQRLSTQTELEAAHNSLLFVRHLSLLHGDTAQAVLVGNFSYKEYGLARSGVQGSTAKVAGFLQQNSVPLLERLNQLLEDKQSASFFTNTCTQNASVPDGGLSTKQTCGSELASRAWTASVPAVKGISNQSLSETAILGQSQDEGLQASAAPSHNSHKHTASSGIHPREEEWSRLMELSPLFQELKEVQQQLKVWASGAGLLTGENAGRTQTFMDVLDAQWECEGDLIPLDPSVLNPREVLVYQHGLFLIDTLNNLKLTPAVSLQIVSSLPHNNYSNNAFRNSFFYQEAEETLFVRRRRLQSVGGFSLLLLHCLSHVSTRTLSSDSSPAFQRLFFQILQQCLGELFQARLGVPPFGRGAGPCVCCFRTEAPL